MNPMVYPYHSSLKNTLQTVDSALFAARLIRTISFNLDVSHTEVEMLLGLASYKKPVSFDVVCRFVPHLTRDRVQRKVKKLVKDKIIIAHKEDDTVTYSLSEIFGSLMKNIDKKSLQS